MTVTIISSLAVHAAVLVVVGQAVGIESDRYPETDSMSSWAKMSERRFLESLLMVFEGGKTLVHTHLLPEVHKTAMFMSTNAFGFAS